MNNSLENKVLLSRSFDSFEELAALARAWDTDFRQVSHSESNHRILQVTMDGLLLSRGLFGCNLVQHGETPRGLRTFALLEASCTPVYWFGRRVGPSDLLVFPADGELEAISRPGFCNHTVSLAEDDLAEYFERSGGPRLNRVLGPGPSVVPLSPQHLGRLRNHLRRISFTHGTLLRSLALYDAYRDKLFAVLLDILSAATRVRPSMDRQARRKVINSIVGLVQAHRDELFALEDLCAVGCVPERTLTEIFRKEIGMTPSAFVKGYKLFGAHRDLWHAHPSEARVADIANAWGFWHMGQFAADYQKVFAELPRATLKRLPLAG